MCKRGGQILPRITNLRNHLSQLVNAYDADDSAMLADIIASARETLGRGAKFGADNDSQAPNRVIIGEENDAYVDMGGAAFVRIDADDIDLVKGYFWSLTKDGYASSYDARTSMHRLIMAAPKGTIVDHIDQNKLNNRRHNLRFATASQNQHNRGIPANNTSGFKGVTFAKRENKWRAKITANGKTHHLGDFKDKHEAGYAYEKAAKELHGEFARLY